MKKTRMLVGMLICVLFFYCLFCCNENHKGVDITLSNVYDTKDYADSVARITGFNARVMRLCYKIVNKSDEDFYFPIQTVFNRDTTFSYINVTIRHKNDSVTPGFTVKRATLNGDILPARDSLFLYVELIRFSDWETDFCNQNTSAEEVAMMVQLDYVFDERDKQKRNLRIPRLSYKSDISKTYFFKKHAGVMYEE